MTCYKVGFWRHYCNRVTSRCAGKSFGQEPFVDVPGFDGPVIGACQETLLRITELTGVDLVCVARHSVVLTLGRNAIDFNVLWKAASTNQLAIWRKCKRIDCIFEVKVVHFPSVLGVKNFDEAIITTCCKELATSVMLNSPSTSFMGLNSMLDLWWRTDIKICDDGLSKVDNWFLPHRVSFSLICGDWLDISFQSLVVKLINFWRFITKCKT